MDKYWNEYTLMRPKQIAILLVIFLLCIVMCNILFGDVVCGIYYITHYYPDKSAEMRYKRKTKSDWLKTFDCDVT